MSAPSRVLLADDHALVRSGLRMILDAEPDLRVVAEAANGYEALAALDDTPTDLAILDIAMPRMTGLQAAREISRTPSPCSDPDSVHVRQRAVLLRSAQGRRIRLRP
jgi:YesN/AraC family two-component response regulator